MFTQSEKTLLQSAFNLDYPCSLSDINILTGYTVSILNNMEINGMFSSMKKTEVAVLLTTTLGHKEKEEKPVFFAAIIADMLDSSTIIDDVSIVSFDKKEA